jgi:hypothetical protein
LINQLKSAESHALLQGAGQVRLTEARIKLVLQAAERARKAEESDEEEEDEQPAASPAAASASAASSPAAAASMSAPPASIDPDATQDIDEGWSDAESPRAAAESMMPSRDSSMDSTMERTEAAGASRPSASTAASHTATGASSSSLSVAGKRKAESEDMEDSPRHKKVHTPTKEQDDRQAKIQQFFGRK